MFRMTDDRTACTYCSVCIMYTRTQCTQYIYTYRVDHIINSDLHKIWLGTFF